MAINPESTRDNITTPGHVFPLLAREGGTLVRAGHTEASVDIARKAGLTPAAVICEIMNDDGTMARLPDLVAFAQHHNLKLGTIADLIAHRRLTERLVRKVEEGTYSHPAGGDWRAVVYANTVEYQEHLVLIKGEVSGSDPIMVRMHAVDLLDDMTGSPHWIAIHNAMYMIGKAGRGVVVMIREHRPTALAERVRLLAASTPRPQRELRDYGIGAQILLDLGIKNMILLTNRRRTVIGLEGYGLNIVEQRSIPERRRCGLRRMSTEDAELPRAPRIEGPPPHLLIVRAPYYREVVDGLTAGAYRILGEAGATADTIDVAGAYELPQVIRISLRGSRKFDGFIALGCIVKGETDHYDFICRATMDGILSVALQFGICLGTGLLTCDTVAQAEARSGQDGHNKGAEAAAAALLQINAARQLGAV